MKNADVILSNSYTYVIRTWNEKKKKKNRWLALSNNSPYTVQTIRDLPTDSSECKKFNSESRKVAPLNREKVPETRNVDFLSLPFVSDVSTAKEQIIHLRY